MTLCLFLLTFFQVLCPILIYYENNLYLELVFLHSQLRKINS